MYSPLNLYYLNQLGITPWVSRECNGAKVIILINSQYSEKEQTLFKRMLNYLNVSESEYSVVNIKTNAAFEKQMHQESVVAVLGLIDPDELSATRASQKSLFVSHAPNYLLEHPSAKKHALKMLDEINQLLKS